MSPAVIATRSVLPAEAAPDKPDIAPQQKIAKLATRISARPVRAMGKRRFMRVLLPTTSGQRYLSERNMRANPAGSASTRPFARASAIMAFALSPSGATEENPRACLDPAWAFGQSHAAHRLPQRASRLRADQDRQLRDRL